MRRPGAMGNHQSTHARPDEQIGRNRGYEVWPSGRRGSSERRRFSSTELGMAKRAASKKRRQRDQRLTSEEI